LDMAIAANQIRPIVNHRVAPAIIRLEAS
jgi:hypothetical protein